MAGRKEPASRVVIVGQGYVGLPIAMGAVDAGHQVVGYESDGDRAKRLREHSSYIDDVSDEALARAFECGRYSVTDEPAGCAGFDVLVITVPTPLREGAPDLRYIERAGSDVAPYVRPGATVILESTTYPGTTEELLAPILAAGSGLQPGRDFHLGYSPERIDPGNSQWTLGNTPKVVSAIDAESLDAVEAFYRTFVETTVRVSCTQVAELTKLVENTFRHVNIALVNELAIFASDLGVDVWEAIGAAETKPFGFMAFRPGPGVGGHCLPVDPSYLSWRVKQAVGSSFRFVELANDINAHMPDYVVRRAMLLLNRRQLSVQGARILVLGLAYKKNSGDARESPAQAICRSLVQLGANVRVADPHVVTAPPAGVEWVNCDAEQLRWAELVLVATDHDCFDWITVQHQARQVLDTRHRLDPAVNVEYL